MPTSFATTIRPGLLVGIKTSIKGNVHYSKQDIGEEKTEAGVAKAKWETERTTLNAVEQDEATKVRGKARGLIEAICSRTEFGLLCPLIAAPDLEKAIVAAKALCDDFNKTATVTKVRFGAITGTIAPDDLQAVRAIRREVSELLSDMTDGVERLDVKTVREAASRAKQLGQMLSIEAQAKITIAIDAARNTAKKLAAAAKAGEQAALAIDRSTIATLTEVRTAFLDIDEPTGEIEAPVVAGRGVDLADDGADYEAQRLIEADASVGAEPEKQAASAAGARQIEFA